MDWDTALCPVLRDKSVRDRSIAVLLNPSPPVYLSSVDFILKEDIISLITCKECGKKFSSDAKICPNCGKEQKSNIGCLGVLGILIIIGSIQQVLEDPKPEIKDPCAKEIEASIYAEDFVKRNLKAPKTAEFAPRRETFIESKKCGVYTILSYVDSQNSFGAMLRTEFKIVIKYDFKKNVWKTIEFEME